MRVYTFVTDEECYKQMRRSFIAAGITEDRLMRLSDLEGSPYGAITKIAGQPDCRYAILCHQDVLLDRGAGLARLVQVLAALDQRDPSWVVAGNAGVTRHGRVIRHLYDCYGGPSAHALPASVVTLDENFLVLNMRHIPRTTAGLYGFHLYGTDVCLNALEDGGTAYVVEFAVTHVPGGGTSNGVVPDESLRQFCHAWNDKRLAQYAFTPQDVLFLSRNGLLRAFLGSDRARAWVRRYRSIR